MNLAKEDNFVVRKVLAANAANGMLLPIDWRRLTCVIGVLNIYVQSQHVFMLNTVFIDWLRVV